MAHKLRIIPLGGLGEVGKNMCVYEYGKEIIVVDAGIMFPDEEMHGIDLVLPDFSYLVERKKRVRGIILTHGHEDHTGALPYLLKQVPAPVFGSKLTLGLVESRLQEHRMLGQTSLREAKLGGQIRLGPFFIEFIRVVHSIPDGMALAIHTPIGTVVHSSDFKFDQTPIVGKPTDYAKLAALGTDSVLAMLSDSTNSEVPGWGRPEREVGVNLARIISQAKGRVITATFASHIHRIQQIIDVAAQYKRKVAIVGRSVERNVETAMRLGYLDAPKNIFISGKQSQKMPPEQVLVLCTGSQGEPLSALTRMAFHDHRAVQIMRGDTVIISATPVPGNEKAVSRTINGLTKAGAEVHFGREAGVHVSGHAQQEELKLMLSLVRPKFFIPAHGEPRQLEHHARLAKSLGWEDKNIMLIENGDVIELSQNKTCRNVGTVPHGVVFVDGSGVGQVEDMVLRDRQALSREGICVAIVSVNMNTGSLVGEPEIVCKGFAMDEAITPILEEAKQRIVDSIAQTSRERVTDTGILQQHVRDVVGRVFNEKIKRRPMIIPVVVEA